MSSPKRKITSIVRDDPSFFSESIPHLPILVGFDLFGGYRNNPEIGDPDIGTSKICFGSRVNIPCIFISFFVDAVKPIFFILA